MCNRTLIGVALAATVGAFAGCLTTSCAPSPAEAGAVYAAQLQACVAQADARAQADDCIARVKAAWADAGGMKGDAQ